ncbi:hypothetical protein AAW51_3370 [Caldimonas brevitalea]|uniref:Uncharacterized protein n=1 Tax=Caldimonas brevitalea TaxID=413882 RepID=A0A0G3BRQ7_9BURK|nr:hypothetical protein AAW51_3370 [Caldimonas brevitalea]
MKMRTLYESQFKEAGGIASEVGLQSRHAEVLLGKMELCL